MVKVYRGPEVVNATGWVRRDGVYLGKQYLGYIEVRCTGSRITQTTVSCVRGPVEYPGKHLDWLEARACAQQ